MKQNPRTRAQRGLTGMLTALGLLALGSTQAQNNVSTQSIIIVGKSWVEDADLNKNGVVNYNEFRQQAFTWFIQADTDLDDVMDVGEYEKALRAQGTAPKDVTAARQALFAAADRDRDGNIGFYELSRLVRSRFQALDKDRDRQLGPNEMRTVSSGPFDLALIPPKQ